MKLSEILYNNLKNKDPHFSFEILPPKKGANIQKIYEAIEPLIEYEPININVTYHQQEAVYKKHESGLLEKITVRKRPGTVAISAAVKYKYRKPIVVPHLICGGFSKEDTENALIDLHFLGMKNMLVLRGDPPANQKYFIPEPDGHKNTLGLIKQIMNLNKGIYLDKDLHNTTATNFSIGIAGYPEKHHEAPNIHSDLKYLKMKVDAGAEYIVTQMFFETQKYIDFVEMCREEGITVPIVPGIKPIRNKRDFQLLPQVFSIDVPEELSCEIEKAEDNKAVYQIGIEWAIKQSKELLKFGVPAVHYYTIGKSNNVRDIVKAVF